MQLQLNTQEVKEAITQYIKNQGIHITNKQIDIKLIVGKQSNAGQYTAEVNLIPHYDKSNHTNVPALDIGEQNGLG